MPRISSPIPRRKSQAALNGEPFRREPGRASQAQQAVLLLRQRMGSDRPAHRLGHDGADAGLSELRPAATSARRHGLRHRIHVPAGAAIGSLLSEDVRSLRDTAGTPLAVLGCPFNSDGSAGGRQSRPMATAARTAGAFRIPAPTPSRCRPAASITTSNENNTTWFRFQHDGGLQAAYTDPINPLFNAISPQPLYSFAAGYTHVFSPKLVNYFNPAFSWYESLFGPRDFGKTLDAFPIVLQGSGANAPFTTLGGLNDTWVQGRRAARFFINDNLAWSIGAHELRFGTNTRIFRLNDYDFGAGRRSAGELHDPAAIHLWSGVHRLQDFPAGQFPALQFPQPGPLCAGHLEGDAAR